MRTYEPFRDEPNDMTLRFRDLRFPLAFCSAILLCIATSSLPATAQQGVTEDAATKDTATKDTATKDAATETGAGAGQGDLDEAVIQRIDADSVVKLESVAVLLESALQKGLDEENSAFAKQMLGSVLLQRAQRLAETLVQVNGRRREDVRGEAVRLLKQATQYDPALIEAYLLIARLNLLPGGSREEIIDATTNAIALLDSDPQEKSAALVLRAIVQPNEQDKLIDLDMAVDADSENMEARQARALMNLQANKVEAAMVDLEFILLKDPTNQIVAGQAVQKLVELERIEQATELVTKMLASKPSEGMYRMRAILYRAADKPDDAMADLNKAIAMSPKDPISLMQRAALALDRDDVKSAKADYMAALEIEPRIEMADEAIELRLQIAIAENRMADAINDAQLLVDKDPENIFRRLRRLRLASLYTIDKRPRKAIDVLTAILKDEPKNVAVLRTRGDALLSVGDHSSAIDDYEAAISAIGNLDMEKADEAEKAEASGLYNNLSWVLATSPNDSVRNGTRSLELAIKASEMTSYEKPHILSTLAAAHAELGNFDDARKWSKKAVELATEKEDEQLEQLRGELEHYQEDKPWREKQETEENAVPILSPEDLIDT